MIEFLCICEGHGCSDCMGDESPDEEAARLNYGDRKSVEQVMHVEWCRKHGAFVGLFCMRCVNARWR